MTIEQLMIVGGSTLAASLLMVVVLSFRCRRLEVSLFAATQDASIARKEMMYAQEAADKELKASQQAWKEMHAMDRELDRYRELLEKAATTRHLTHL